MRRAGVAYVAVLGVVSALTVHSGLWRYHDYASGRCFSRSPAEVVGWQYEAGGSGRLTGAERAAVAAGLRHLAFCERWGLLDSLAHRLRSAWLHVQAGLPAEAAGQVRRAIGRVGENADLWLHLAKIETFRGDTSAARGAFASALSAAAEQGAGLRGERGESRDPTSARVWTEWGIFLAYDGDAAGAAEALERAVSFDRGSSPSRTALGSFQIRMGEIDAARRSLIAAVSLGPGSEAARRRLAGLGSAVQDHGSAVSDYLAALRDHADVPVFHRNLARALTELRRYEEALEHYRAALRLVPGATDLQAEYGAALLASGDVAGAISVYEDVVAAVPTNSEAAGRLAFLYAHTGRGEAAIRLYEVVLQHGDEAARRDARRRMRELGVGGD